MEAYKQGMTYEEFIAAWRRQVPVGADDGTWEAWTAVNSVNTREIYREQEALFNAKAGKYGPAGVAPRSYERQFGATPGTPGGSPDGQMTHVAFDHSDDEEERALRPCPARGGHAARPHRAPGRGAPGRRAWRST